MKSQINENISENVVAYTRCCGGVLVISVHNHVTKMYIFCLHVILAIPTLIVQFKEILFEHLYFHFNASTQRSISIDMLKSA